MSSLSDIVQRARAASAEFEFKELEVAAAESLKEYWARSPHSAMEYLESCALAFPYQRAQRIVRDVTLHWMKLPGYSWSAGGNADHCFLSALLLTANYDLVAPDHFEKCWESALGKTQYESYYSRMRDREPKLTALRRAEVSLHWQPSGPSPREAWHEFGEESRRQGGSWTRGGFDTRPPLASQIHQRQALPLHSRIVTIFGGLAALCVLGGIVAIIWNAVSRTEFKMFEVTFNTGHVGVAFVAVGVLTAFFTTRLVLKNQYDLAALPPEKPKRRRKRGTVPPGKGKPTIK